ncbi:MAG: WYL domain-containing protein [bacterium]
MPANIFFDAKVLGDFKMKFIELEKIYRQKDTGFINLLNAIRNNSITEEELENINQRHNPDFECCSDDFYIYLTPTNAASQEINEKKLRELDGKLYHYEGLIGGNFDMKYLPTDINLNLKVGAQVMMLNNDARKRWVNGTIGKIVKIKKDKDLEMDVIFVEFADGEVEEVVPYTWDIYDFYFDKAKGHIESSSIGSFTQYPMKLAWSVTIHKSQGKTFDKVVLDIGRGTFAHGQMYVALSRCTSLEGIVLKKKILKQHIWMDYRVVKFVTRFQYDISEKAMSLEDKIEMIEDAIAGNKKLAITYLKANDIKSKRTILPREIGEMEFMNKTFIGVSGMCLERGEGRTFRVDRILEMKILGE